MQANNIRSPDCGCGDVYSRNESNVTSAELGKVFNVIDGQNGSYINSISVNKAHIRDLYVACSTSILGVIKSVLHLSRGIIFSGGSSKNLSLSADGTNGVFFNPYFTVVGGSGPLFNVTPTGTLVPGIFTTPAGSDITFDPSTGVVNFDATEVNFNGATITGAGSYTGGSSKKTITTPDTNPAIIETISLPTGFSVSLSTQCAGINSDGTASITITGYATNIGGNITCSGTSSSVAISSTAMQNLSIDYEAGTNAVNVVVKNTDGNSTNWAEITQSVTVSS